MLHIKTPATTANMGPGFDSIGMALSLYNNVWIEELESQELIIESSNDLVPKNKDNMIYMAIEYFYEENNIKKPIPGLRIKQEDSIPMARGLGSSAACVVSGLIAGNIISGLNLSKNELAFLAAKFEGHPDNTAPAILGGVIVGVLTERKLEYIKVDNKDLETEINFATFIPEFQLLTEKARNILPEIYTIKDVVFNSSRSALLMAALINGDFEKLSVAMEDRVHQPYRSRMIPGMTEIIEEARKQGAIVSFLSGAGPTLISVTKNKNFCDNMQPFLKNLKDYWNLSFIKPDFEGATVAFL